MRLVTYLPAEAIQPAVVTMPVALQGAAPVRKRKCKKQTDFTEMTHRRHILDPIFFNSSTVSPWRTLAVTRFSSGIPEERKHKTAFEILSFNADRLLYFQELISPCVSDVGFMQKKKKSLRLFSLFHTKVRGQRSLKASLL